MVAARSTINRDFVNATKNVMSTITVAVIISKHASLAKVLVAGRGTIDQDLVNATRNADISTTVAVITMKFVIQMSPWPW